MMPTLPSSFTYCRPFSLARACTGSIGNAAAIASISCVTEQRVVVDGDLGVERDHPTVVELHERVHLHQGGVALPQQLVHPPQHVGGTLPRLGRQRADQLAHVEGPQTQHRVDVHAPQRLRARARELLDVHAALGGHHRQVVPGRTVEQRSTCRTPARSAAAPRRAPAVTLCPLKSAPSMRAASSAARSGESTSTTPPPLPRPPTCTCTFTTLVPPSSRVASAACSAVAATMPVRRRDAVGAEQLLALMLVQIHGTPSVSSLGWTSWPTARRAARAASWRCHRCSRRA